MDICAPTFDDDRVTTRIPPIRFFPVEIRRGASRRGSKMSYQFDSIDGVEIQKGKPVVVKGWHDPKTNIMNARRRAVIGRAALGWCPQKATPSSTAPTVGRSWFRKPTSTTSLTRG